MKLLLYSHFFAPSVGGTETIVLSIARGLAELRTVSGLSEFEITLVTQTPAEPTPLTWHLTEVEKTCIRQNWTDIESTLATKVKEFLHSPVSSPDFTKPPSIRREHAKEGLYLHEVIR